MNANHDKFCQSGLGTLGGLIGGVASIWAVPVTIYLLMKNVKPKQFVDVSGFLIMIGCIPVSIGYIATGVFQPSMFVFGALGSVACLLYTFSEPTRQAEISYAVFCLKKKN